MSLNRTIAPAISEFDSLTMPPITTITLSNGIALHYYDNGRQSVNALTCLWQGGSAEAPVPSIAALAASMLREGTDSHSGNELSDIIEYSGARLFSGADSHHSWLKLYSLNSTAARLMPLMAEMLMQPTFPDKAVEVVTERGAQQLELKLAKVEYIAAQAMNRVVMGSDSPLTRQETPDEIRAITADMLRQWHYGAFPPSPSSFSLYLAGRVDQELIDCIDATFGQMPVSSVPRREFLIQPFCAQAPAVHHVTVENAVQSAVKIAIPTIGRNHPDYIDLRLLTIALGGYFGSRLMANIREDKGYTYGIHAYLQGHAEGGIITIDTSTAPANVEPLLAEVDHELKRLLDGDFTDDELARMRQYCMTTLAATLDSPFDIMDYHVTNRTNFIPPRYFENQVKAVKALNAQTLARIARTYIDPGRLTTVIAGPKIGS